MVMKISIFLFLLIVVGFIAALLKVIRLSRFKSLPAGAKCGSKTSVWVETSVVVCTGLVVFIFAATKRSTGGLLLMLDDLSLPCAAANICAALLVLLGLILSGVICFWGKTSAAIILEAFVLIGYGLVLNGPWQLLSAERFGFKVPFTIMIGGVDVEGARLWVNGVELGELPYSTTIDEFVENIPYWDEEPKEPEEGPDTNYVYSYSLFGGTFKRPLKRWIKFELPDKPNRFERFDEPGRNEESRTYYAQVKLGDEWGYSGDSFGGGGGGGGATYKTRSYFSVIFPERQNRLESLLNKVRISDYKPSAEWFEAMETFKGDGLTAVYKAIKKEPQMNDVLDAWARWKYNLDGVIEEGRAMEVFELICDEVESKGFYKTDDIAGHAVELLIPYLNPERIAELAMRIIHKRKAYGWNRWKSGESWQFGSIGATPYSVASGRLWSESIGSGFGMIDVTEYPIIHAVWKMDEYLNSKYEGKANVFEEKVIPLFIAYNYNIPRLLLVASVVAPEQVAEYAMRQDWGADVESLPYEHRTRINKEVNCWLYLLVSADCDTGRRFRKKYQRLVFDLADIISSDADVNSKTGWDTKLDFLFIDFDGTTDSLAWQYWKRFNQNTVSRFDSRSLQIRFNYLAKLEPLATVDMYVEAWKSFRGDRYDIEDAMGKYPTVLPEEKRLEICQSLKDEVEKGFGNIELRENDKPENIKKELFRIIENFGIKHEEQEYAKRILGLLQSGNEACEPKNVKGWLADMGPGYPLIDMLAGDNEPVLKMIVFDTIEKCPTPANRQILQKLLNDENEEVRQSARDTEAELKALAELPYAKLVSYPW